MRLSLYEGCALLYLGVFSYLITLGFNYTYAQENTTTSLLDVELKPSPNIVNVGENLNLGIVLKNNGNSTTNLTSITLLYPEWGISNSNKLPISLESNQSKFLSMTASVPYDLNAGTYQLVLSVNANGREYFGESSVEVRKFQAFDLSGQLPVSIIGIIITGLTAYFIVVYIRSGKFERNLSEMILAGIVFGIVSWFLLGKSIDQVANSGIYDYFKAIGIAISLAFLFSLLYVLLLSGLSRITTLLDKLNNYRVIREWRIARIRADEGAWITLFRNIIRIRDSIGFGYTFHIKIYLKSADHGPFECTGLLWKYDEESRNIVIHPRYVGRCFVNDKQKIINSLINLTEFTKSLSKDMKYKQRLLKYVGAAGNFPDAQVILWVRNKLTNTNDMVAFGNDLQEIDFSRFVRYVFEEMNLSPTIEYDNITYIPADDISSLEIVSYQTRYAIRLYRFAFDPNFIEIPKTHVVLGHDVLK